MIFCKIYNIGYLHCEILYLLNSTSYNCVYLYIRKASRVNTHVTISTSSEWRRSVNGPSLNILDHMMSQAFSLC